MKILSDLGKALETMSQEIEKVPIWFFPVAAFVMVILAVLYFGIIPRLKTESAKRDKYRRYCIYGMLLLYGIGILAVTVFTREAQESSEIQLSFFDGFWKVDHLGRAAVRDVLNLIFFVPFGFFVAWVCKDKKLLIKATGAALALSVSVELWQLLGNLGAFDVDDILFNALGGLVGAIVFLGLRYAFQGRSAFRYCMRGVFVLSGVFTVCVGSFLSAYHFMRLSGLEVSKQNISSEINRMDSKDTESNEELDDPDVIRYHGKKYRYNENLTTVLFMGIDQRSKVIEEREGVSGESGQADTIFLLVMNHNENKLHAIGVSRDTMSDIKTFDYRGNYLGKSLNHIGLAYAFGDGKETSCQYMVDAVSNLFYGIPINAYVALNMEALIQINDSVGGVTVRVPEDLTWAHPSLVKGETLTLQGRQALIFMKFRDTSNPDSNSTRMIRQKQYIVNFMKKAAEEVKKDATLPATIYQSLTDGMVTNISMKDAVYLVTEALSMSLDESSIMMLKSEAVQGSVYDEIYVDDEALYELILDVFYKEETEGEEQ